MLCSCFTQLRIFCNTTISRFELKAFTIIYLLWQKCLSPCCYCLPPYCCYCLPPYCCYCLPPYCCYCLSPYCCYCLPPYCCNCLSPYCCNCLPPYCCYCLSPYCCYCLPPYCCNCLSPYCCYCLPPYYCYCYGINSELWPTKMSLSCFFHVLCCLKPIEFVLQYSTEMRFVSGKVTTWEFAGTT